MEAYQDSTFIESFKKGTGNIFAQKGAYARVQVLLLTWSENDLSPDKEVAALKTLLEGKFHYDVQPYQIPSNDTAEGELLNRITAVIRQTTQGTLLIVYYAGHCEKDSRGHAQWAAWVDNVTNSRKYGKKSPTLSWHVMQQLFFTVQGDVLLLLDCCNAALLATGTKGTGKFEMIGACGKNSLTVAPSNESFTRILMHELKPHVEHGIYSHALAGKIRENSRFNETPVFHDFVRDSPVSILLQRLAEPLDPAYGRKASKYVVFLASLSDDITGHQIADWLKLGAPRQVIGVDIEALILQARRLQGMEDESAFAPGSVLGKLSQVARSEIMQALRGLHTTMDQAYQLAVEPQIHHRSETAQQLVGDIHKAVTTVRESIQMPILQDASDLDQDAARSDPFVDNTEASESIDLRRAVLHGSAGGAEINRATVTFKRDQLGPQVGMIKSERVVLETFKYTPNPNDGAPYHTTIEQVQQISGLLSSPAVKHQEFRILPFRGFFHDRIHHQFGLVFDGAPNLDTKNGLCSLRKLYKTYQAVPLGHRVRLIDALCVAIERFHCVRWVHKGIRSSNIVFHSIGEGNTDHTTGTGTVDVVEQNLGASAIIGNFDLAQPCLFGFEYARADDQGTNLQEDNTQQYNMYRHPDRWSRPKTKYTKSHDIYALGIVMVEIALWKDIESISIKKGPSSNMESTYVYQRVKEKCQGEVGHRVGDVLAQAIMSCLEFEELTKGLSEYEAQLCFQHRVKNRVRQIVGRV